MELNDKKILVSGGAGFFGSAIVRALVARGVTQENIIIPRSTDTDLRLKEDCKKIVKGVDAVVHAAGVTGNAEFHRAHPAEILHDNLMMGVELMDAAYREGVKKFITIGSATEYPTDAPLPLKEGDLWVGKVEPIHEPYSIAKKALLMQAEAYKKQYGFDSFHVLMTNMYGPGEHADGGPIPSFIKRVGDAKKSGEKTISIWGTGKPTRDFLYVDDAARGILLALEKYEGTDPVNFGSGRETSIIDLIKLIAKLMDFKGEITTDPTKPDGQPRRILDTSRAEKAFGFHATTSLEDGLAKTIAFHAAQ